MPDPIDEHFKKIMKQFFKDMEEFEKDFKIKKIPEFKIKKPAHVERGGFSISITSNGKNPPKIEVKRFGPGGNWEKVPLEKERAIPQKEAAAKPRIAEIAEVKEKVIPEYKVLMDVSKLTISLDAEGVENKENVRLRFYPGSVEIYAVSRKLKKGYFCTVALPDSADTRESTVEVEKDKVIINIPRRFSGPKATM